MLVRMLVAAAKPALATGAIAASAAGAWLAYDNLAGDAPTAFERLQSADARLIVSEFGASADAIVALDPADPASREVIATIDHAPEYGILASLAPSGDAVAYTALPPDAPDPGPAAPAVAAIVDADGTVTTLATDIDLLVAPVWTPDGNAIVVRKNTPCDAAGLNCDEYPAGFFELLLLGRDGSRATLTSWRSAAAFPIAFSPDAATLYFATLSNTGTDLYRVGRDATAETLIAHLSDQVARDWRISPDGAHIVYSSAESGAMPAIVARTVELPTGAITDALATNALEAGPPSTGVARGEFNPVWTPDGEITVASMHLDGGASAVTADAAGLRSETSAAGTLDLPLDWAPDGSVLVVRAVDGPTPFEAGPSHLELIAGDGSRERISESSDVLIVGWTQ